MVSSTDHVTGVDSLTLTITASKDGGAFASIAPTVTGRSAGWYSIALTAGMTDTVGDLAIHITAPGADPCDLVLLVEAGATDADVSSRSTFAGGAVASVTGNVGGNVVGSVGSVTGLNASNLDAAVSSRLATSGYTAPDNASITICQKILRNRIKTDPASGVLTIYDDDSVTPYMTALIYKDAAGTTAYNGTGAELRNRLA